MTSFFKLEIDISFCIAKYINSRDKINKFSTIIFRNSKNSFIKNLKIDFFCSFAGNRFIIVPFFVLFINSNPITATYGDIFSCFSHWSIGYIGRVGFAFSVGTFVISDIYSMTPSIFRVSP